ncbi:hypothetical protein IFM46972_07196 [Aspergillus udagawae]|uniref:Uncharacterized protein n=1 Tax=Aspergillus udagawae TaxID=91492 RepID=A0A8H3P5R3_9EURO|nr:hypothetical protein IFM46972_07196 [Aspergillus udagawae]
MGAHSGNRGGQSSAPWTDSREPLATGPSQEQHVPVRGFNAAELKAALRRGGYSLVAQEVIPVHRAGIYMSATSRRVADHAHQSPSLSSTDQVEKTQTTTVPADPGVQSFNAVNTRAANTMANGKDFFLELRKQVTALRQGATVPGG